MDKQTRSKVKRQAGAAATAAKNPPPPPAQGRVAPLFRRIDWIALLIAFATVAIIYFFTLAPEETLEDSGELCTGAFYAGIPHAPGYPFWSIYAWLWTKVLPIGNVAWRVEVGEAFAAAMACGLVAFMVSRGSSLLMEGIDELKTLSGKCENAICLVSGVVAGVLLGLGGVMWSESVAINRISLFGVPWVMIVMLCLMRWIYAPHQRRYLYIAMFCFGICVTVHQTLLVAAMGIEVVVAYVQPRLGRNLFLGNSIIYVAGLAAQSAHLTTMLDTAWMVKFLFHAVGILSFAAFLYLAARPGKDPVQPLRDAVLLLLSAAALGLFFAAMKYPLLFVPFVGLLWALVSLARKTKAMGWEWLVAIALAVLWLLGASFYFYEAIAGMTNPPMEWGYPRTVEGFFHALSRGQYQRANPSNFLADPLHFLLQLGMLIGDIVHEYNWVCLFIALVPLMFYPKMRKRERSWMLALVAVYSCIGLLLMILMNPSPDKQSADLNRVFFTSSHAIIAIMIGYGFALTTAYLATHYQRLRKSALMLGAAALAPGLVAFYDGVSNTFYGGLGITPYSDVLGLFFLLAASLTLVAIAARWLSRLSEPTTVDRKRERMFFLGFAAAAIVLLAGALCLVYGRPESLSLAQIREGMGRLFAPNQYSVPAIAGLLVLAIVIAFIGSLLLYRRRAPLALSLALVAVMPVASGLSHWAGSEQRHHWFGYWFGHDMFTPPVVGPDGKMTYDPKVRAQQMKGTNGDLVYPEMEPNTILFGGTDPGRFNPTYMIFCDSFLPTNCLPSFDPAFDRRDVYLITQNALADDTYLDYLRAQYFRSQQKDPPFFSELARYVLKDGDYQTNLLARMVSPLDWFFEARGARIEKRWRTFTSWFTAKDFLNLPGLVAKLRPGARQDPVSAWLYQNFSQETRDLIAGRGNEERLAQMLARDLNVLLGRELTQERQLGEQRKEKDAVDQQIFGGDDSERLRRKQATLARVIAAARIEPLYDATRFAQVNLSEYLRRFIAQNPLGDTRIRLNRLLLEAAYPGDIARSLGGVYPDREIYIPSEHDLQRAFAEYSTDAARRARHDQEFPNEPRQVQPGESIAFTPDGHVQVSGQVAVMSINGLLTKVIFDHNPDNHFYVEESFPLNWMFPHLTPFGIIMKINRQPLPGISDEVCRRDHEFWSAYSERLIGNWITYDTSIQDIVKFIERVYVRHDFTGFQGDRAFIRDQSAQKSFSKLRSSIGGIYAWRLGLLPQVPTPPQYLPRNDTERQRMIREAEFAYKQAWAFCPYSPDVVVRYVSMLMQMGRLKDALMIAQTCLEFDPENDFIGGLVQQLEGELGSGNPAAQIPGQIAQLERQWRANPADFQAAFALAQRYIQLQQTDRAFQVLDGVLNNPHVPANAVLAIAQACEQFGKLDRLGSALDKLVKLSPADLPSWGFIAQGYARLRRPEQVETAVAKLKALAPTNAQAWIYSAEAYAQLNDIPKLASALEEAVKLDPDQPETWYNLAAAQASLGQATNAIQSLKHVLELNAKRLARNPKALDLRAQAEKDPRFAPLRQTLEYRALMSRQPTD